MAEKPAKGEGMERIGGMHPLLALSPVFIVVLEEGKSVLVYICKKEMGESIVTFFSPI